MLYMHGVKTPLTPTDAAEMASCALVAAIRRIRQTDTGQTT